MRLIYEIDFWDCDWSLFWPLLQTPHNLNELRLCWIGDACPIGWDYQHIVARARVRLVPIVLSTIKCYLWLKKMEAVSTASLDFAPGSVWCLSVIVCGGLDLCFHWRWKAASAHRGQSYEKKKGLMNECKELLHASNVWLLFCVTINDIYMSSYFYLPERISNVYGIACLLIFLFHQNKNK